MPFEPPPDDSRALADFPQPNPPMGPGRPSLYRIFTRRDPATGRRRSPYFFASGSSAPAPGEGGRYDLPAPHGACYFTEAPMGAWLEKFRMVGRVSTVQLRRHALAVTRPPHRIRTADLTARGARRFGLTGDVHTSEDRVLTRAWAARLYETGFRALAGKVRHDPSLKQRSLTLLDEAGEHPPFGWRWRTEERRLEDDAALLAEAAAHGYGVLAVPDDVPTREPDG